MRSADVLVSAIAVAMLSAACVGGAGRSPSKAVDPPSSHTPVARMLDARPGFELIATTDREAATAPGLYASTDGVHWRNIAPPTATTPSTSPTYFGFPEFVDASFVDALTGWVVACQFGNYRMTVYETVDGGSSWQESPGGGSHCEESIQTLSAHLAIANTPGVGVGSQILAKSNDGGQSWQDLYTTTDGRSLGPIRTPVVFADEGNAFSASLIGDLAARDGWPAGYFAVSRDGGRTWTRQIPPAAGGPPSQYALPVFSDPDQGVLATLGGTGKTTTIGFDTTADGGRTWQPQTSRPTTIQQGQPWPVFDRDPTVAVASATTWWVLSPTNPVRVEVTIDAGRHWTSLSAAGLPGAPDAVHAIDVAHAWATVTTTVGAHHTDGTDNNYKVEVYATSDGGNHWAPVMLPPGG